MISIIALISSSILTVVAEARAKARDIKRITDIKALINGMALEYATHGHFPCHQFYSMSTSNDFLFPLQSDGYIARIPSDPINIDPYTYGYATLNTQKTNGTKMLTATCGTRVFMWFSTELPLKECPASGILINARHCHLFIFDRPDCGDLTNDSIIDSCAYRDIHNDW